ncbi:hypothetical protein Ple7327_1578 [Pleurocapsa sp. PCC 7327]|nr:hypothetical protein Ple7327_1578 [Pleurocapsa sp. PCC 7327]
MVGRAKVCSPYPRNQGYFILIAVNQEMNLTSDPALSLGASGRRELAQNLSPSYRT